MWNRKELKQRGKAAMRANYWHCVIVSLLIMALAGTYTSYSHAKIGNLEFAVEGLASSNVTNSEIVDTFVQNTLGHDANIWAAFKEIDHSTSGILATVFNDATASGSIMFGALNATNHILFKDRLIPGIIILVGVLGIFAYWLLIKNILRVGRQRFFLENRQYSKSPVSRLLYIYRIGRVGNVAKIMFLRSLYLALWALTIVGGVIKSYSYRMVPLIVAENPDISAHDAFRLSRSMMDGQKWNTFVLDVSFLGWVTLSALTFGLFGIFYASPYMDATDAELYMALRAAALENPENAVFLNDTLLDGCDGLDAYPTERFTIPERPKHSIISSDYKRSYDILDLVLLFFVFSFIGYIYEVIYYLIATGSFINRGTMYGPWLPVYGTGGVVTLLLLRKFIDKPVQTFFLSMGLCGVVEYLTAWGLETFAHTKWWDYTGFFLNLQGRICLEGLITFGLGCCASIYLVSPTCANLFGKLSRKWRIALLAVLVVAFAVDAIIAIQHPNMAAGVAL